MTDEFLRVRRPPCEELPARDRDAALSAAGGDEALARELLDTLIQGLPGELSNLRALLQARDWPGIDDAAHGLRGATAYCGVPALSAALRALSDAAKSRSRHRIAACVKEITREAERLGARADP